MRDEPTFLTLDGMMIALASIAFTVAHPGFMFPPMRKNKKATAEATATATESEPKRRSWLRRSKTASATASESE
jgi:RTA1 like protein